MRLLTDSFPQAKPLVTCVVLMALLSACGEVSYKRGGSQQDIDRAHQACRGSGDQLAACLAEQGWQKPKIDAMDPLFATIETSDNHQEAISKPSPFIELVPEKKETPAAPAVVKTPHARPVQMAEPAPAAEMPAAVPEKDDAKNSKARSTANDGPDVQYAINSWWKMGAFPDKLKQDQLACEKKLGPDYLPDYKTQTFKRAFVVCMHDFGWMAIRNVK